MPDGRAKGVYDGRYPRNGQLAILCEGDVAGYEVQILEQWLSEQGSFVDVWPCGTKTAIYGMSDAVGRSIATVVIEDRDFRSIEEARKECGVKLRDRRDRGVQIIDWRSWLRNEIENYLIEPDVVANALSEAFGISRDDVIERLRRVIRAQRTDQAAMWAIDRIRRLLPDPYSSGAVRGLNRKSERPVWDDASSVIVVPAEKIVADAVKTIVSQARERVQRPIDDLDDEKFLDTYRQKVSEWQHVDLDADTWKNDWSGKEVLHWLFRAIVGEFGWQEPAPVDGRKTKVEWSRLNSAESGRLLREIEYAVAPRMRQAFLSFLRQNGLTAVHQEWKEMSDRIAHSLQ
jgi:hypothetical protein